MPAEAEWIIQCCAADPTSGSLRQADVTSGSIREEIGKGMFIMPVPRGMPVMPAEAYTAMKNGLKFATVNRYPCPD